MLEFLAQISGGQSGGTTCDQMNHGGNEAAEFGKADVFVMPKTIAVKLGGVAESVPLAIVGVTPEVAHLLEMAPHGDQRATELLSQFGEHPAGAAVEEFSQPLCGWRLRRHEAG